ncbi:MAG TPA: FKBP-type peptidyl-prolyl cis-trans isomerase [Mucilaginibacter sp.]
MRQRFFTLLLISAVIGLASCRKDKIEQTIQQYDDSQIQNYISVFGLSGMQKAADTTGIYYKIIMPGKTDTAALDYPSNVSFVFTIRSFDGKFVAQDTIANHVDDYLGHITSAQYITPGVMLAIKNLVKYKGASARLLVPSRLAYGVNGFGSGSSTTVNTRIAGNQCLDYYIHIIHDYKTYDEEVIHNRYDVSTYTKVESVAKPGYFYYYKILTPGTGNDPITPNSTITDTYTGSLLNGTVFDGSFNGDNIDTRPISDIVLSGLSEALEKFAVAGTKISVVIPSTLAYGNTTSGSIPANSVLRFTYQIITVIQ